MKAKTYTAKRARLHAGQPMERVMPRQRWFRNQDATLVIADPPYNLRRDYGEGVDDAMPPHLFEAVLGEWCRLSAACIHPGGHVAMVLPVHLSPVAFMALRAAGLQHQNTLAWCYRFGQHTDRRFISAHADVLLFSRPGADRIWRPDRILEPSDRAAKYGDARIEASSRKGMRVPLDTIQGDFLGRIQGGNAERRHAHDNQLPERLVATIVAACSDPGDLVVDPFSGSGTTGAVCKTMNRQFVGIELQPGSAKRSWERIKAGAARADRILAWDWNGQRRKEPAR
jgi:hypothetical protein